MRQGAKVRRTRPAIIAMLCLMLGACSARPPAEILAPTPPMAQTVAQTGAKTVKVYAVTTRKRDALRPYAFGAGRASDVQFVDFDISIPATHVSSQIQWPGDTPDPATDFVTLRQANINRRTFLAQVNDRDVGVFVHGYNYSFQEAVFRAAQMGADAHLGDRTILFSWPSEAQLAAYMADRDAVDYSRDALVKTLTMLVEDRPAGGRVKLLAHSMGARLTMEALRQLRLQGQSRILDRLDVILAAPDIDVDVFRQQAAVIGPMREPITVLVASDDRALALSSRLSAGRKRVGAIDLRDPRVQQAVKQSGMRVVDISSIPTDSAAHSRYVDLIALYPQLEDSGRIENPVSGVRQVGAFVFDSVGQTFDAIGEVLSD